MKQTQIVLIIAGLALLVGLANRWHFQRAARILGRWAADNGYDLLTIEHRFFRLGPFWWRTSKGQVVYWVVVQDRSGVQRAGYVRVGSWFFGVLSDTADVIWRD